MRRRTFVPFAAVACVVAVAIPATGASAASENSKAEIAKQCAAEKKADKAAFRATYGKHAMRNCIKGITAVTVAPVVTAPAEPNAAQTCDDLRDPDPPAFQAQWGTNTPGGEKAHGTGQNAFGQCTSSTAQSLHGGGPPA